MKKVSGNLFSKKISVFWLLIVAVATISMGLFAGKTMNKKTEAISPSTEVKSSLADLNYIRQSGYELISPLLLIDKPASKESYQELESQVNSYLQEKKSQGIITSASVYVKVLKNGDWMSINENELYSPGSLMKVVSLITWLKQAETNPAILDKELFFKKHYGGIPEQTLTGPPLKENTSYKVKDLLYDMIVYSDNDATATLNNSTDFSVMQKLFADLQLEVPRATQQDYLINVKDFSKMFRVLYNSSYLNRDMSRYALQLLTKSAYKQGIVKDIDSSVVVAHKFGERNTEGVLELHEFGIVYYNSNPYLIGVMTKGNKYELLPEVLDNVSKIVFEYFKKQTPVANS